MRHYVTSAASIHIILFIVSLVIAEPGDSSKFEIADSTCKARTLHSIDSASLLQLTRKDALQPAEDLLHANQLKEIFPIEVSALRGDSSSSSLAMTKAADAVRTWCLLVGGAPEHMKMPSRYGTRQSWEVLSGSSAQHRIIACCAIVAFVFLSMWAWKEAAPKKTQQSYSYSRASIDEMLTDFSALPMNWRHICIYICAMMSYAGTGAVNDTIGLAFGSFQAEWGVQSPSRLACLSLACTAGQITASVFAGAFADSKGRCCVTRYASLLVVFCFWFSSLAPSLETLAVFRFFAGLGFGTLNVTIPTLLSECLPKHMRCLLVLYQFGWPLGAAAFTFMMSVVGWRAANVVALPCVSLILALFWCPGCIPESPGWLSSHGKLQEAVASVTQYGGTTPRQGEETATSKEVEQTSDLDEPKAERSLYIYMALAMLCVSMASMLIKVWLPSLLALRNVPSSSNAFVTMWILEAVSICASGVLFGSPANGTRKDTLLLLRVAQASFIIAGLAVLGYMKVTSTWLITILGAAHLLGQANASNFLMAFATLSFPVAIRARCIGVVFLAQYVGGFVGPLLGSLLLQFASGLGAGGILMVGGLIYTCGYFFTLPLCNPNSAN